MCDDLEETIAALKTKGVATAEVHRAEWGKVTSLLLPSGGSLGLYEPLHATAIAWPHKQSAT